MEPYLMDIVSYDARTIWSLRETNESVSGLEQFYPWEEYSIPSVCRPPPAPGMQI